MKFLDIQTAVGAALLVLTTQCDAKHGHQLSHLDMGKRHNHRRIHALDTTPQVEKFDGELKKRGSCAFPTDAGLVAVTPGSSNGGWALSPDQTCDAGKFCPYACPSGQVMAQWNPLATSYTYPLSMDGGLFCGLDGTVSKPFPNQPYCVDGTGAVGAQNNVGGVVSFCQTVLPGNEAMLIPTAVESWSQLAVPGLSYWCETAAHYYINPPSIGVEDACVWSDGSKPLGNWAPYVAGANTVANGETFVKIGWNPIFTGSGLSGTTPTFGVSIECEGDGCNGLPCAIDPASAGVGGVSSADQATGAGGANFCVVTVPAGVKANIVVFPAGDPNASGAANEAGNAAANNAASTSTSAPPAASTTSTTESAAPTTSSTTSSSSSSTSSTSTYSESAAPSTTYKAKKTTTLIPSTTVNSYSSAYPTAGNSPHLLFENATSTTTAVSSTTGTGSTFTNTTASPTPNANSAAPETLSSGSIFSLLVMFAVAGYWL